MAIIRLYRGQCSGSCERYVADTFDPRVAVEDTADALDALDERTLMEAATAHGWSLYPFMCPECIAEEVRSMVPAHTYVGHDLPAALCSCGHLHGASWYACGRCACREFHEW